jgi:Flp pilus assembly protein TadD/mono/diheme cytochrome c family protein
MTRAPSVVALTGLVAAWLAAAAGGLPPLDAQTSRAPDAPVTFTHDVAPILFTSCASCHRPQGSAPFSLLTFDDVRPRADRIVEVTAARRMPPWKPEPGHGSFAGERRLTDAQLATIKAWRDGGTPPGDPADLPPLPTWSGEWLLGTPDLVLETAPYTLRATGDDMYRNFVLRVPGTHTRYIKAWQFIPGNTRVVHHATMQFDATGTSRRLEDQDPQPGYEGLLPHGVQGPDGYFLDWGPGHTPYVAPDGMAWPLRPGIDLVMMLHLRPSGAPEPVQAKIGLYFSDTPPTRTPALIRLTRQDLDIPAGEANYVATDSFRVDVDIDLYTVQPHAHYLAKRFRGWATRPDGSEIPLILIRDWEFDWQGVFRYAEPVHVPAGSTLHMEIVYDNATDRPGASHDHPSHARQRVTYGQRTSDEMAELWFQALTRRPVDRDTLANAVSAKVLRAEIVGHEKMLESDPANVALHNTVALMYNEVGNRASMTAHFAAVLKITPDVPAAHYNYGMALLLQGRDTEARERLAAAITLAPDYALAHDALGTVLERQGELETALTHYRRAAALNPGDTGARKHVADLEARLAARPPAAR